jgi:hypothetical protein
MGKVYRAHDVNLEREVPIKILPDEFSRDKDRGRRFQPSGIADLSHLVLRLELLF